MKFWKKQNNQIKEYFNEQLIKPKESTKEAFKILHKLKITNLKTLDLACGNGANLMFLKKNIRMKIIV